MRSRRPVAAGAITALLVALVIVAGPLAANRHASSTTPGAAHHAAIVSDAPVSSPAVSALDQSRRSHTFAALIAYLAIAAAGVLALFLGNAGGASPWVLLPSTDLTRRGRAPPFARA